VRCAISEGRLKRYTGITSFWATVCKTVRPMLSDRCLSACVSVCYVSVSCNVGVLWPNGWLDQDALTTEVGFGPDDIVLDGDPAPRHRKGQPPTFRSTLLWNSRPSQHLSDIDAAQEDVTYRPTGDRMLRLVLRSAAATLDA